MPGLRENGQETHRGDAGPEKKSKTIAEAQRTQRNPVDLVADDSVPPRALASLRSACLFRVVLRLPCDSFRF